MAPEWWLRDVRWVRSTPVPAGGSRWEEYEVSGDTMNAGIESHGKPDTVTTATEAAAYLNVSTVTRYTLIKEKGLPAIRLERQSRIPRGPFDEWLTRQAVKGDGKSKETDERA